jgi:cytochrome c
MKRPIFAILVAWAVMPATAHAGGDPARGAQDFKQCGFCHATGPDAMPMVGPPLNGVVGRVWGTWPHYSYSAGLVSGQSAGRVWDDATLDRWLAGPQKMVPGTKMALDGLNDPQQRADIIAYLKQFNQDGTMKK